MHKLIIFIIIFLIVSFLKSCDLFDRKEYIPSYIKINNISFITDYQTEGSSSHAITDAWLYVDNKEIGVFELPFTVPVLEYGKKNITIHPGIKNNGSDSHRVIYQMMNDYRIDTLLTKKETTEITPEFRYRKGVVIEFHEDFDGVGNLFEVSEESSVEMHIIDGEKAYEGRSLAVYLDDNNKYFECRSTNLYELPKYESVYLEINHKSTDPFVFGLFAKQFSGTGIIEKRIPVFTFNPSPYEWRKTYVELNYHINTMHQTLSEYRLFFTCVRPEKAYGDITEIFIDNIKILY